MRTINGLHVLLVCTIFCGMVQTAAGQSSAKAEVLAALAERNKRLSQPTKRKWRSSCQRTIFRPTYQETFKTSRLG